MSIESEIKTLEEGLETGLIPKELEPEMVAQIAKMKEQLKKEQGKPKISKPKDTKKKVVKPKAEKKKPEPKKEDKKPSMKGYKQQIIEATGCNPKDADEIEDIMRNVIFHSTLDWQNKKEFDKGAVEAYEVLKESRGGKKPQSKELRTFAVDYFSDDKGMNIEGREAFDAANIISAISIAKKKAKEFELPEHTFELYLGNRKNAIFLGTYKYKTDTFIKGRGYADYVSTTGDDYLNVIKKPEPKPDDRVTECKKVLEAANYTVKKHTIEKDGKKKTVQKRVQHQDRTIIADRTGKVFTTITKDYDSKEEKEKNKELLDVAEKLKGVFTKILISIDKLVAEKKIDQLKKVYDILKDLN